MITHEQLRAVLDKRWRAVTIVDGRPVDIVGGLPTRTLSRLRPRNTAQVTVLALPPPAAVPAHVDLILEDVGQVRFFTGQTTQRSAQSSTLGRVVNLLDFLPLTQRLPSNITWTNRPWADAVRDVLVAGGVSLDQIDTVFDPGTSFAVGSIYAVTVTTRETVGSVLQELLDFAGAAVISTPTGRVRVISDPGIPAASSQVIYARGANLATEYGIFDAQLSIEGRDDIVSSFTATGPRRPDGQIPDGTFTAASIRGRSDSRQYRHAQTDAVCQLIARREVERRAREATVINVQAPLNPLIEQGDTILFRDPAIGYDLNTPAIVEEIATTEDAAMTMKVSLGPSLVLGYGSSIEPPVVDFAFTVEQQLLNLAGAGLATRIQVQARDQSRDRQGYAITSRSWTATGPGASPTSSSEREPLFSFTDLTGATITLAVTSASGESASLTRAIRVPAETQTLTRLVSVAAGSSGWRILNGPDGWRAWSGGNVTAVPAINDQGGSFAGGSGGQIWRSFDALVSAPTLLTTLSGSVGALWVNEGDPLNIIAGHGNRLSRSLDGGASWLQLADLGETVYDLQSSPANPNEIRVAAGNKLYRTFNAINFGSIIIGAAGSEARGLATAGWGRGVVFSGTGLALADAIRFEDGATVDWSGVDPAERPANGLTAITPLLFTQGFLVAEGAIRDLIRDGSLESLALYAANGSGGRLYRLLKSGATYTASLVGASPATGAGKALNAAAETPGGLHAIDDVAAVQIAYGSIGRPPASAELLIATQGLNPGGVWHRSGTSWTLKNSGLPANWYWQQLIALAKAPATWLLFGNSANSVQYNVAGGLVVAADNATSPLWITTDNGATWTPATLTAPAGVSNGANRLQRQVARALVGHPETVDGWALTLSAGIGNGYVWRGAGTAGGTGLSVRTVGEAGNLGSATPVLDRDGTVVIGASSSAGNGAGLRYLDPAASVPVRSTASYTGRSPAEILSLAPGGNGRRVVAGTATFTGVLTSPDYRTTNVSLPSATSGIALPHPVAVEGRAYGLSENAIWRVEAMFTTPAAAAVYTATGIVDLTVDAQRRLVVAGRQSVSSALDAVFVVLREGEGGAWQSINGPGGAPSGNLGPFAVISREV